jgi:hypothetical protein
MREPSECVEESTVQILLPGVPTVGVFCIDKMQGGQDHTFLF